MNFLDKGPETKIIEKSNSMRKLVVTMAVVVLLGLSGAAAYFYKQYDALKKNPNMVAQNETRATIEAVGKLIELPQNEEPTIATVTDPDKLKEQEFFKRAQVGDKVLVYTQAKKAFLYNPTTNKIVDVAPINIGDSTNVSGTTTTETNTNP